MEINCNTIASLAFKLPLYLIVGYVCLAAGIMLLPLLIPAALCIFFKDVYVTVKNDLKKS